MHTLLLSLVLALSPAPSPAESAPAPTAQKGADDAARQAVIDKILKLSDGGKKSLRSQEKSQDGSRIVDDYDLNKHWVGTCQVLYATEFFKNQAREVQPQATRINHLSGTILMSCDDHYQSTGAFVFSYRENLPSAQELKDPVKHLEILKSFGRQHGFTDGWGGRNEMNWTEGWSWFSFEDNDGLRGIHVFAMVSAGPDKMKKIKQILITETLFKAVPADALLAELPSAEMQSQARIKKQAEADAKFPQPLRALVEARHTPYDSDLKAYFAALHQARLKPNETLIQQLVAAAESDGSGDVNSILEDLFHSDSFEKQIGVWKLKEKKLALDHLLHSLPKSTTQDALENATLIYLRESQFGQLKFKNQSLEIDISASPHGGFTQSTYRIEGEVSKAGEAIRDFILSKRGAKK